MTESIQLSDIHPSEHHEFRQASGTTDQRQQGGLSPQACMVCRKSVQVERWEDLQPGDHIETPMVCCCLIVPTYHHAIVKERKKPQNDTAKIIVIDVERKFNGCSRNFKIDSHELKFNGSEVLKCKFIKKVDYKCRGNSKMETLKRANHCLETPNDGTEQYCLFLRNCEHFAVDMVSGDHERDNNCIKCCFCLCCCKRKSTSLQSVKCFWIFMHILFSALHCIAFGLNFYLYAVYGRHNENYNHWFGNTETSKLKWCYTGSKTRGFRTRCDWLFLGSIAIIYLILYVCLLICQSKVTKKVCRKCKVSSRLTYLTKLIIIILFDILNIFAESWLYILIEILDFDYAFTIFILIMVILFELILGLFIFPHLIVKHF